MGGGNAQKSAIARARNQKDGEKQGSQLKMNAAAANIKCKICMQLFMCTANEATLKQHSENKHPKASFTDCFPDFVPGQAQKSAKGKKTSSGGCK